jgi:hypothetical protein
LGRVKYGLKVSGSVRADANVRTYDLIVRIDEHLATLEGQFEELADVRQLLSSVRDDFSDWKQEFLAQALTIGRTAFKPYLDDLVDLWRKCVGRWGTHVPGYKEDIASNFQQYFETTPELDGARKRVESGLEQAWGELVLERLIAATRVDFQLDED